MGWPCRRELWGDMLAQARDDYATVANAIAVFEPVTMIANPGDHAAQARAACGAGVDVVELPLDDSWLRDCGPIYVLREDGRRRAVHFGFNAWGGKFSPWDKDAAVGGLIADRLGDEVVEAPLVLEGGSILSDGEGTLLTTEQCLLNPNRNPSMSREGIEDALRRYLGATQIVWLGQGLIEDRDTDGHVDLIAALTRPGQALLQTVSPDNPNYERCEDNRARLDAAGIEVVGVRWLPYVNGTAVSYLNLYVCNGAVIVPATGADCDDAALALIAEVFAEREVVAVPGTVLAYGGGGPHCITQQLPSC